MQVVRESIFSVFIDSKLLIFLFSGRIHFSMDESVLMLSYIAPFYEMAHRPYIFHIGVR